jgi:uncharacterized membrane protein YvbJ
MALAHCTNCGHEVDDVVRAPCPQCGDTRISVSAAGNINAVASVSARGSSRKLEEEMKKNWPLIAVLAAGDLLSTIPAYLLSGWASVTVTFLFIVESTILGYYAVTRVVKITITE